MVRRRMNLSASIKNFMALVADRKIQIYNEFSLQHELGIHLRGELSPLKVQFERNVSYFGLAKSEFEKKEIDISVFSSHLDAPEAALELKYPRGGQYPEQMFSFCKDIVFLEQLAKAGFKRCMFMAVADGRPFFEGPATGIYSYFRGGKSLHGKIVKPTGSRDKELYIEGRYDIFWSSLIDNTKYTVVDIVSDV